MKKTFRLFSMGVTTVGLVAGIVWLKLANDINTDPDVAHFTTDNPQAPENTTVAVERTILATQLPSFYSVLKCETVLPPTYDVTNYAQLRADFNAASARPLTQLCLWAAFDPFKAQPGNTEAQNYWHALTAELDISDDAFNLQRHFQETFQNPLDNRSWERKAFYAAFKAIINDDNIQNAYREWKPQWLYDNKDDALEQYKLKLATLRKVTDHIRNAFGLNSIPVYLHHFGDNNTEKQTLGAYDRVSNTIRINYDWNLGVTDDFYKFLKTAVEEAKHSVDSALIKMLLNDEIKRGDPRAVHAAALGMNNKMYLRPKNLRLQREELKQTKKLIEEGPFGTTDTEPVGFKAYRTQYIERTAKYFARHLSKRATHKLDDDVGKALRIENILIWATSPQ